MRTDHTVRRIAPDELIVSSKRRSTVASKSLELYMGNASSVSHNTRYISRCWVRCVQIIEYIENLLMVNNYFILNNQERDSKAE